MLNAILLLGSSYNKHKRISMLFTIAMVLNLIFVQFGHVKTIFFIYNTTLLLLISFVNKKISNNTIKIISCSFSIIELYQTYLKLNNIPFVI